MLLGTITQPPQVTLYPLNYKGSNSTFEGRPYVTESLTVNDFPLCCWAYDAYQAWVAQNAIPLGVQAGFGTINAIGEVLSGNPIGGVLSAAELTANLMTQKYQASIQADICKGSASNGGVTTAAKTNSFYGGKCTITHQIAKSIDDYFTIYGYGVKCMMKPVYNARPYWTYIKTVGATITGSVPCDDMRRIVDIFDHGITFWTSGENVGNYTLNNSV